MEKGDIGLVIFGGNLLYIHALMMPISLTAFGVNYNQPLRRLAPKPSSISVQIIVRIWPATTGSAPILLAATSMAVCINYLTKIFNRSNLK